MLYHAALAEGTCPVGPDGCLWNVIDAVASDAALVVPFTAPVIVFLMWFDSASFVAVLQTSVG